jgi:hypothetical protein
MQAFEDTWTWDELGGHASYEGTVEAGGKASRAMQGLERDVHTHRAEP